MRILMITNTYIPHVGGVARSVSSFSEEYRRQGHEVLIIAPRFEGMPEKETGVVRVPAIQNFNGSDFSVILPVPVFVTKALADFEPDLVHSHHPFLLGDTALRIASMRNIPLIFTHHTMYEQYTHYVPGDSPAMQRFAIELSTGYANLCDIVVAPSESVASLLEQRGVRKPIHVVPTGIDHRAFERGNGAAARNAFGISRDSFVVGHIGRLAEEKNLGFLSRSVLRFCSQVPNAHFLVAGQGVFEQDVRTMFQSAGLADRLHLAGCLVEQDLIDAYHAMDVFAFASHSETQGMVLAEAMAARKPVVAVDAPGAREVIRNGQNGYLLPEDCEADFCAALVRLMEDLKKDPRFFDASTRETSMAFSLEACAGKMLAIYQSVAGKGHSSGSSEHKHWPAILRTIEEEWNLWSNRVAAIAEAALGEDDEDRSDLA